MESVCLYPGLGAPSPVSEEEDLNKSYRFGLNVEILVDERCEQIWSTAHPVVETLYSLFDFEFCIIVDAHCSPRCRN